MQRIKKNFFMPGILAFLCSCLMITVACAKPPQWTLEPLTDTVIAVPSNTIAIVQYRVTNQSNKQYALTMRPIQGIKQITTGQGVCSNPFVLQSNSSCTLSLKVNGSQLESPVTGDPVVCQQGNPDHCYRLSNTNILHISQAPPITDAVITAADSPLKLAAGGSPGELTIHNMSTEVAATNIKFNFIGTDLEGRVEETANSCQNVPPLGSCILTYAPGSEIVSQENFTIQGTNTNALTAAIAIQSGVTLTAINPSYGPTSGETGVTLTGSGLSGATEVWFGGLAATHVNAINSTKVTVVTPEHLQEGAVDVTVRTPSGDTILSSGYEYLAPSPGQFTGGGRIACVGGGLNNLIAATTDSPASHMWSSQYTSVAGAQSKDNGSSNTQAIVNTFGSGNNLAATFCDNYEVDSHNNTPCMEGICYNDWFLPAKKQLACLYSNRSAIGGFNTNPRTFYWSSTERGAAFPSDAWRVNFNNGFQSQLAKTNRLLIRCVRAFTP